ncbi:MAG: peptide chain release factor 2 [Candidatus Bipolaricaulia bacterium]
MIAFDPDGLAERIARLEAEMAEAEFWEDQERVRNATQQFKRDKELLNVYRKLEEEIEEVELLGELAEEAEDDEVLDEVERRSAALKTQLREFELQVFMDWLHAELDCFLTINAGAGGTDAQDWAEMLLRMYLRWVETHSFRSQLIEVSPGEVAGIKSATIEVDGVYSYGYLKGEQGVHRLVRISPYDAGGRRHTSFASVTVTPKLEDIQVDIKDDDLKIETFRSSGAGGQHVNVTDSAVRTTHLPTGIVVSCQNERSQHQNRETALKILKAKLHTYQQERQLERLEELRGELKDIEWGHQIRSYILHPYRLVKDHRTEVELGDVDRVLDGDLDVFIESYLKQ